ncbi:hypothetical protein BGZ92_008531 [Podila epicladia]|nr:hypothetical protein BGZ92_008531 [Podila epicladia]
MTITLVSSSKHFGGSLAKYSHVSKATQCTMHFNVFLPKSAVESNARVPVIYCLGGLTSTEDNFAQKGGAASRASKYEIALVFPDTSPRNTLVAEAGENSSVGYSAGFYLNATQAPWDKNWKMYDYVAKELPEVVSANLPIDTTRSSIMGHSMGGHGALSIFLKNQNNYKTVSAFAPILSASTSPWGLFALPKYLGPHEPAVWGDNDVTHLLKHYVSQNLFRKDVKVLIDQGTEDSFLKEHLYTHGFINDIKELGIADQFEIRFQDGYDHGYFFISTFVEDHIDHHAKALGATLHQ